MYRLHEARPQVLCGRFATGKVERLRPRPTGGTLDRNSFYVVDSAQSEISRKGAFLCPWNGGDTFGTDYPEALYKAVDVLRSRVK